MSPGPFLLPVGRTRAAITGTAPAPGRLMGMARIYGNLAPQLAMAALLSVGLPVVGCTQESPAGQSAPEAAATSATATPAPPAHPPQLTDQAAKDETGARALLLDFARAIELRRFDQAWALLGATAQGQLPQDRFAALLAPLAHITVAVPGGTMDGGAGSLYYTAPITITGTGPDGAEATLAGEVILRRVNDVDGATPDQLQWHIERLTLQTD